MTGPPIRLPRAERREQIARAAAAVFVRGGFDGTSMDDVAREAGVTRLIVYRIFETKEDLYRAVLDMVVDDVATSVGEHEAGPDRAARDSIVAVLLGVARRHPDAFRLLWRHATNEPAFHEVAELFRSAAADYAIALFGESFDSPALRRWAAESVVAHLYESLCLWLDHGDPGQDDRFLQLLAGGVRSMVQRWTQLDPPRSRAR